MSVVIQLSTVALNPKKLSYRINISCVHLKVKYEVDKAKGYVIMRIYANIPMAAASQEDTGIRSGGQSVEEIEHKAI